MFIFIEQTLSEDIFSPKILIFPEFLPANKAEKCILSSQKDHMYIFSVCSAEGHLETTSLPSPKKVGVRLDTLDPFQTSLMGLHWRFIVVVLLHVHKDFPNQTETSSSSSSGPNNKLQVMNRKEHYWTRL